MVELHERMVSDLGSKLAIIESAVSSFSIKQEAIKYTLKVVADQPPDERKVFHDSYSKALKNKPFVEPKHMNATDQMNVAATMFWPEMLIATAKQM